MIAWMNGQYDMEGIFSEKIKWVICDMAINLYAIQYVLEVGVISFLVLAIDDYQYQGRFIVLINKCWQLPWSYKLPNKKKVKKLMTFL